MANATTSERTGGGARRRNVGLAAMPDQPDVEAYLSHLRRGAPVTAAP
ncbi:MAG TPA: hypothetical protein VMW93_06490 [bacterium]|nr:hypothetical protein [bacterium]